MKIPPDAHLYYITDLQLKRLRLVQSSVAREIENQGWISDAEEERIKREVHAEPVYDEEKDQTERDRATDDMIENSTNTTTGDGYADTNDIPMDM